VTQSDTVAGYSVGTVGTCLRPGISPLLVENSQRCSTRLSVQLANAAQHIHVCSVSDQAAACYTSRLPWLVAWIAVRADATGNVQFTDFVCVPINSAIDCHYSTWLSNKAIACGTALFHVLHFTQCTSYALHIPDSI